jgi:hypothetical protein
MLPSVSVVNRSALSVGRHGAQQSPVLVATHLL